jgi:hypothetical protein
MAAPSGSTSFSPVFSDLVLEIYSRIQVRPAQLTQDHLWQCRYSASLMVTEWSIKAPYPNLWKLTELQIPLQQGVSTYSLPQNCVGFLDSFIRTYEVGNPVNVNPSFSTTLNSPVVQVALPSNGLLPGQWVSFVVPVSIGGILVSGFYQVLSVIDVNNFTIQTGTLATATISNSGAVPVFTTVAGSSTVTVSLANHGLLPNDLFQIQTPTSVGGLQLSGPYTVLTTTANSFTFNAGSPAGTSQTVAENSGQAQIEVQIPNVQPFDRILYPMSRTDYAAQPFKQLQSPPTQIWVNRQITPTVTTWPVADQNGPYVLHLWTMVAIDDIVLQGGVGIDMPQRFFEAFAAGLAAKLAVKFPPPKPNSIELMIKLADAAWQFATGEDVEENVGLSIMPALESYYR